MQSAPLRLRSLLALLLLAPGVLSRRHSSSLALRLGLSPLLRRGRLESAPLLVGPRCLALALRLRTASITASQLGMPQWHGPHVCKREITCKP